MPPAHRLTATTSPQKLPITRAGVKPRPLLPIKPSMNTTVINPSGNKYPVSAIRRDTPFQKPVLLYMYVALTIYGALPRASLYTAVMSKSSTTESRRMVKLTGRPTMLAVASSMPTNTLGTLPRNSTLP